MLRSARPLLSSPLRAFRSRESPRLMLSTVSRPARNPSTPSSAAARNNFPASPYRRHAIAFRAALSSKDVGQDKKLETETAKAKLESDPSKIKPDSPLPKLFDSESRPGKDDHPDVLKGVKQDLNSVKDTFALSDVPRDSLALGLSGTLPYVATSFSTLYLAWNLRTQYPTSSSFMNTFMLNNENAGYLLGLIEPIQLGYGAVIISFLGAIHWGLELGEKTSNPARTKFRYAMGVAAPAVAWPTLVMPFEYALIAQFSAFTGLYFADTRAAARGWTPPWYGTYRFVLTFIVGGAILISLLGRSKAKGEDFQMQHATEHLVELKHGNAQGAMSEAKWKRLEKEEKERIQKEKEEAEKKKKEEEAKNKKEKKKGQSKSGEAKKSEGKDGKKDDSASKGDEESQEDEKTDKKEGGEDKKEDGGENEKEDASDNEKSEDGDKESKDGGDAKEKDSGKDGKKPEKADKKEKKGKKD